MTKMNKLILSVFVVVCVAVVSAKDFNAEYVRYDIDDDQLGLRWPGDCARRTLVKYARKCNLKVSIRWNGYCVRDPASNVQITTIPWIVRNNQRCRNIISALTARCEGTTTTAEPSTTDASYYNGEGDYQ
ncbi:uncharacterized protein LOC127869213 isoform X3 [Dreissena polymorpha]|uniref:uncharacterized protein LOC127869213 isoform X3 n=1 Tax=Dreissena polymorpha TaxID=45954 RepID=UPI0022646402|nr:uncharacterized protein LOC127869213 isoform X3 [Dreissena polymorpha]